MKKAEIEKDIQRIVAKHIDQASLEVEKKYGHMHFVTLKESEIKSFKNGIAKVSLAFTRAILRQYYDFGHIR